MRKFSYLIAVIIITALSISRSPAHAATEFSIITDKGSVSFAAEDHWPVLAMQTKLPAATAVFQIPDPADNGTQDSTNLAINLYQPDSDKAKAAIARFGEQLGETKPVSKSVHDWTVYKQEARQGTTIYTIMDAKKNVADVMVIVRLAWPHLASSPADQDKRMETIFQTVLDSVHGEAGPHKLRENEVIRRKGL